MSLPEGYRVVEVPESRKDEFLEVDRLVWASDPDPELEAAAPVPLPWDRTVGVEAGGGLVAVHASYPFTLPVPGGAAPCSGLTWVGVRADHRRRGLLTAMIEAHLARSLARGEAVSALFAAEPSIYGRFGYGSAADELRLTVPRGAALRPVPGSDELSVRFASFDPAAHTDLVDAVHRAAGRGRPGWVTRDSEALRRRFVADAPSFRKGAESQRLVTVHASDGEPRGYALLRRRETWTAGNPRYTAVAREAVALDAAAAHRLWSLLLDLDLTAEVETGALALDDPLPALLVDRRAARPTVTDNLWLRLLDVPAALAARRYAAPVDVVLEVSDALLPANAGRWRVTTVRPGAADGGEPGAAGGGATSGATGGQGATDDTGRAVATSGTSGATTSGIGGEPGAAGRGWAATVERTDATPDLRLDVRELGAAYLGGRSLAGLARAGLVEELRPGAAHAAGAAFGWPLAAVCSWVF